MPAAQGGQEERARLPFVNHEGFSLISGRLDGVTAMSGRAAQNTGNFLSNFLSAFALMIGSTLGISLPVALVIIWICS